MLGTAFTASGRTHGDMRVGTSTKFDRLGILNHSGWKINNVDHYTLLMHASSINYVGTLPAPSKAKPMYTSYAFYFRKSDSALRAIGQFSSWNHDAFPNLAASIDGSVADPEALNITNAAWIIVTNQTAAPTEAGQQDLNFSFHRGVANDPRPYNLGQALSTGSMRLNFLEAPSTGKLDMRISFPSFPAFGNYRWDLFFDQQSYLYRVENAHPSSGVITNWVRYGFTA